MDYFDVRPLSPPSGRKINYSNLDNVKLGAANWSLTQCWCCFSPCLAAFCFDVSSGSKVPTLIHLTCHTNFLWHYARALKLWALFLYISYAGIGRLSVKVALFDDCYAGSECYNAHTCPNCDPRFLPEASAFQWLTEIVFGSQQLLCPLISVWIMFDF